MAKRAARAGSDVRAKWEFYGGSLELMYANEREVLLAGPAGSGKSISALFKLHQICESREFPGVRCLIVRKTRESLTESGLASFESKILPPGHPASASGGQRKLRQSYRYPNGSEIIVGGLDKPSKIMSTEFDVIFVQEATELHEQDWNALVTRLRNNVWPIQQMISDCNPDSPTHWLKQRCDRGVCRLIESRHEDNPAYFDREKSEWTSIGREYLKNLEEALTGPQYQRLRKGLWVQSDGVVYPDYDPYLHLIDRDSVTLDPTWRRVWSVDFGFNNPFVWQAWAINTDDEMYRYREIYMSRRLVEDHAGMIRRLWREEAEFWAKKRQVPVDVMQRMLTPEAIVCDHDSEDRATLERHLGLRTTGARKMVKRGIQIVSERLKKSGNGRPRLFLLRDSLVEIDKELMRASRPYCTEQEFSGYVMDPDKDEPVKKNDHGIDALRYSAVHVTGGMFSLWEAPTPIRVEEQLASLDARESRRTLEQRRNWRFGDHRNRRGGNLFGGGK